MYFFHSIGIRGNIVYGDVGLPGSPGRDGRIMGPGRKGEKGNPGRLKHPLPYVSLLLL